MDRTLDDLQFFQKILVLLKVPTQIVTKNVEYEISANTQMTILTG